MFRKILTTRILPKGITTLKQNVSTSKSHKTPIRSGITLVFGKYLLATNTISSGVLMILGDIFQQEIEYQRQILDKRYDVGRLGNILKCKLYHIFYLFLFSFIARMFIVGLALGPLHHYYYVWIAEKWPARTAKVITWKIMLDQFVMSPLCIATFFYGMGGLERKTIQHMNDEITNKFKEVYLVSIYILVCVKNAFLFNYLP